MGIRRTVGLVTGVRAFLRGRMTVAEAEEQIRRGLEQRDENFLHLVQARIFDTPDSPYLPLFKMAGCAYSDLRESVRRHGVNGALERLAAAGVYLTSDEFKGKTEVVRNGISFRVSPELFLRPQSAPGYIAVSSGTRNQPVSTFIPLEYLAIRSPVAGVFYAMHDLFSRSHAMYDGILPASPGMNNLLISAKLGLAFDRWFSHPISVHGRLERSSYYFLTQLIVLTGKVFGPGFPRPRFITIDEVDRIVRWIQESNRRGRACCVTTAASNAGRIARTAWDLGASLQGTTFIVTGEPFTESKREAIARVGAKGVTRYAYGGGMNVGFGCADPRHTDDVHVNEYFLALLAHPIPLPGEGAPIHPLLCTSLSPVTPRMLLNVESGDYAILERRECGCALGRVGLTLHVQRIRSFEKFTSEGLNYFYGDLFDLFERALPAEFGGGPGDYQLVEEEDQGGQTRLTLVVHPAVGELDEGRLLSRLQASLEGNARGNQFMTRVWQGAGTLRVQRRPPHASPRGKILPLHIPR